MVKSIPQADIGRGWECGRELLADPYRPFSEKFDRSRPETGSGRALEGG